MLDNRRRSPERASRTTLRMTGDRSTKQLHVALLPVRNIALSRVVTTLNALIRNKKLHPFFRACNGVQPTLSRVKKFATRPKLLNLSRSSDKRCARCADTPCVFRPSGGGALPALRDRARR